MREVDCESWLLPKRLSAESSADCRFRVGPGSGRVGLTCAEPAEGVACENESIWPEIGGKNDRA